MNIDIVTVTYNSSRVMGAFLSSLEELTKGSTRGGSADSLRLIVVDSGSTDQSATRALVESWGGHFISSSINVGYGTGSNIGARSSHADWLIFMNPDVLAARETLLQLVEAARISQLACAAPQVFDSAGRSRLTWGRVVTPPWRRRRKYPASVDPATEGALLVDTVSGCCMAIPRKIFLEVGGFDESFFLFSEEMDLHRRMALRGHKIGVIPHLTVVSDGGKSSDGVADRWRLVERSVGHVRFMRKHYTFLEGVLALGWNIGRILVRSDFRPRHTSLQQFFRSLGRR